jgi:hypothetical protein
MAIALSVAYLATPLPAGAKLLIFATPQLSAGVSRPAKRSYRLIAVTAAAAASPANILTAYTAKFGALVSGRKIFIRGIVISSDGFASNAFEQSQVIT